MAKGLEIGQTFPEGVSVHFLKARRGILEKQLEPLVEKYQRNERLLEILGIENLFKEAAACIKESTGGEAETGKSPKPSIVSAYAGNVLNYDLSSNTEFDGGCSVELNWEYQARGHVLKALAVNGNQLRVSASEKGSAIIAESTFDVEADGNIEEQKGWKLDEASEHILHEGLFSVFEVADNLPEFGEDGKSGKLKLVKSASH